MVVNVFFPLILQPWGVEIATVLGSPPPAGLPNPSSVAAVFTRLPSFVACKLIFSNHFSG